MKAKRAYKYILKLLIAVLMTAVNWGQTSCSVVLDGMEPHAVRVSDYCPRMKYCEEGAHVICMYYNPNEVAGPGCGGFMNVTITADLALEILAIFNAMRAKLAMGLETGKDGQLLPRGYGIMRLKWDGELATFAQVMANQCSKRGDMCRASNKFPDPAQNTATIKFARPNWRITVREEDNMMKKINSPLLHQSGLNKDKVKYGVYKMLESWYNQKDKLEPRFALNYPNFTVDQTHLDIRRISNLLSGTATHIGCGISAFSQYIHHNTNKNTYNSIVMVCNISGRPKPGQPLYEVLPPSRVGYTIKCGCPPGYEEDKDCLCYESPSTDILSPTCAVPGKNCKPVTVLLPIVTTEDVPPPEDFPRRSNNHTLLHLREYEAKKKDDIFRSINDHENDIDNDYSKKSKYESNRKIPTEPNINYAENRYFNKIPESVPLSYDKQRYLEQDNRRLNHEKDSQDKNLGLSQRRIGQSLRSADVKGISNTNGQEHLPMKRRSPPYGNDSIFSRVPKFELPPDSFAHKKPLIRDVAPRKDFTNTKILLDNYLKRRKGSDIVKSSILSSNTVDEQTSYLHIKNDLDKYLTDKFNYKEMKGYENYEQTEHNKIKSFTEDTDQKFMKLLDTLEQEVKHVELNMKEKEIVDAKIRKIYGHIVGRPVDNLAPKHMADIVAQPNINHGDEFIKYETAVDKHFTMHNLGDDHFAPQRRPQENLSSKDEHFKPYSKPTHEKFNDVITKRRRLDTSNYQMNPKKHTFDYNTVDDDDFERIKFKYRRNHFDDDNHLKDFENDDVLLENNAKSRFNRERPLKTFSVNEEKRNQMSVNDDILDVERRNYYQERLDKLGRQTHADRGLSKRKEHEKERERRLAWSGLRRQEDVESRPNRDKLRALRRQEDVESRPNRDELRAIYLNRRLQDL